MSLFSRKERGIARAIGALSFTNPFLAERIELEQEVLGDRFTPIQETWSVDPDAEGDNPNVQAIRTLAEQLAGEARNRLFAGVQPLPDELQIYEELVLYVLYYRYEDPMYRDIVAPSGRSGKPPRVPYYSAFAKDAVHFLAPEGHDFGDRCRPDHLFALFFQLRRAFHFTFRRIFGSSMAAAHLRASVWQSIFTCDMRRYRRTLHLRMHDMATLITGPSGTGKELVASAIGLSSYIPFDAAAGRFAEHFRGTFHPVNLSALAPTLVESELFGHKRGAFTGADSDRTGYLEQMSASHTVFLDEIGDVAVAIQLKLLRVLQSREFQKLGDCLARRFGGKIIAATNRDLSAAIRDGCFRADLYYRLCSDRIHTPSLRDQISEDPDELAHLAAQLVRVAVGPAECDSVTGQVIDWIMASLGPAYPWPGNMRELEQCIRNILVQGAYRPLEIAPAGASQQLGDDIDQARLTADELLSRYCTLVYARCGEYSEAARLLDMDPRTLKSKIDKKLLESLRA